MQERTEIQTSSDGSIDIFPTPEMSVWYECDWLWTTTYRLLDNMTYFIFMYCSLWNDQWKNTPVSIEQHTLQGKFCHSSRSVHRVTQTLRVHTQNMCDNLSHLWRVTLSHTCDPKAQLPAPSRPLVLSSWTKPSYSQFHTWIVQLRIEKDLNLSRALTGFLTNYGRIEVRTVNIEEFYTYLRVWFQKFKKKTRSERRVNYTFISTWQSCQVAVR